MGVALGGVDSVIWGWTAKGKGFGVIVASWFISPLFSGLLGILFYNVVMYMVMKKEDSFSAAKIFIPFYFFFTIGTILFYFAYKGAPVIKQLKLEIWEVCLIAFVPAIVIGLWSHFWLLPKMIIPYVEKKYAANSKETRTKCVGELDPKEFELETIEADQDKNDTALTENKARGVSSSTVDGLGASKKNEGKKTKVSCLEKVKLAITAPLHVDVVSLGDEKLIEMHSEATKFDVRTERLFSFLQIVTATCASFSHGANDLANALSPMATVYTVWLTGTLPDKKFTIPFWQIVYCAIMVDFGLWFLGHRIMKELGNNLTYISPSRGFNMELAAMFTVLTASRLGIPVSTTHCITGATAGVAMAEGKSEAFNWNKFITICWLDIYRSCCCMRVRWYCWYARLCTQHRSVCRITA
jgi:sodium-dependent phosphate transporter